MPCNLNDKQNGLSRVCRNEFIQFISLFGQTFNCRNIRKSTHCYHTGMVDGVPSLQSSSPHSQIVCMYVCMIRMGEKKKQEHALEWCVDSAVSVGCWGHFFGRLLEVGIVESFNRQSLQFVFWHSI